MILRYHHERAHRKACACAACGWRRGGKEVHDLEIGRPHHRAAGSYVRGPRVGYIPITYCADLEQRTIHSGRVLSPQGFDQETRSPAHWQGLFRREAMNLEGNTIAFHCASESSYQALTQMIRDQQRLNSKASAQAYYWFGRR